MCVPLGKKHHWREQFEELKRFLVQWHGPFDVHDGFAKEEVEHLPIPDVLKEFYTFTGKRGDVINLNELVLPSELDFEHHECDENSFVLPSQFKSDHRFFVFYYECQTVYLWATDNRSEEPQVFGWYRDEEDSVNIEEEQLSGFLCQLCMFETLGTTPYQFCGGYESQEDMNVMLHHWNPFPFGSWHWPEHPTRFYYAPGALALGYPVEDGFTFECGAQEAEHLEFMKPFIDENWHVWDRRHTPRSWRERLSRLFSC